MINPLGFTLENFDAVGRFRDEGERQAGRRDRRRTRRATGKTVKFAGARDLATFLADSEEVHAAFVEQLFHHLVKQPVRAYGPTALADLRQGFAKGGFNMGKLVVEFDGGAGGAEVAIY